MDTASKYFKQFNNSRKKRKRLLNVLLILSVVVIGGVFWQLRQTGVSMSGDAYCGYTEHQHSDECYEQELVCTLEEEQGHIHTDECYVTEVNLVCEEDEHQHGDECYDEEGNLICESEDHTHGDECYAEETKLVCTEEEHEGHTHTEQCYQKKQICGYHQEHVHTLGCYSDPTADVETPAYWEKTIRNVELGDVWSDNLIAIAKSQLGYHESHNNYVVANDGVTTKGYSRYGAWYGDSYGEWCAMFISWCLNYADITEKYFPYEASCRRWIEELQFRQLYGDPSSYQPNPGDIIFFDWDADDEPDHVGIVTEISNEGKISTIEGNSGNVVRENTYEEDDRTIFGYGALTIAYMDYLEETGAALPEMDYGIMTLEEFNGVPMDVHEVDFAEFIKKATLQYSTDNKNSWKDYEKGSVIPENAALRFEIDYQLPPKTLGGSIDTIRYELPDNVSITQAESGTVYNSSGQEVGTYTVNMDETIEIKFYDKYIKQNSEGAVIDGSIRFNAELDRTSSGDKKTEEVIFNSDVKIEATFGDEGSQANDLTVKKSAGSVSTDGKTVEYTIEVSSVNGTKDAVNLEDVMSGALAGAAIKNVSVTSSTKGTVTVTKTDTANGFTMQLPQMSQGEKYTIKYTATISDSATTAFGKNQANVSSKDKDNKDIKDSSTVDTSFVQSVLKKSGEFNQENGMITWTITIDAKDIDVSGMQLSDMLNGVALSKVEGDITLKKPDGSTQSITLPHTFATSSPKGVYTITYTTKPDVTLGSNSVNNKATLGTSGSDKPYTNESNVWVGDNHPLTKKYTTSTAHDGTTDVTWNVTFENSTNIGNPWTLTDSLSGDQYYTEAQKTAIQSQFASIMSKYSGTLTWKTNNNKCVGFEIEFQKDYAAHDSYSFTYTSTAVVSGAGSFYNEIKVADDLGHSSSAGDTFKTYPTIVKTDLNGGSGDTSHLYQELKDGLVAWRLQLHVPDGVNFPVTVTETLPKGVSLDHLVFQKNGSSTGTSFVEGDSNNYTLTVGGKSISATVAKPGDSEVVTITITKDFYDSAIKTAKDGLCYFLVYGSIDKHIFTNNYIATLNNHVEVREDGGKKLGEDDQSQTIKDDKAYGSVGKKAGNVKDNIIPYSIKINQDAKDLMLGSDMLTLTDELKYAQNVYYGNVVVSLVPESIHIYQVRPDGSKGEELTIGQDYQYTYHEEREPNSNGFDRSNILTFTIPDSTALIVEYRYKIDGTKDTYIDLKNSAKLTTGADGESTEGSDSSNIKISQSSASANTDHITIYKVDSENYSQFLHNAVFKLERWDPEASEGTGDWVSVSNNLTTDAYGKLASVEEMYYDTAYRLTETTPPEGYEVNPKPYEFYIRNSSTDDEQLKIPEGFDGDVKFDGAVVYYPNKMQRGDTTSIKVKKLWMDSYGNEIEPGADSINVQLWRRTSDDATSAVGSTVELNAGNQWTYSWDELPTSVGGHDCTYYVVETTQLDSQYQIVYAHKGQSFTEADDVRAENGTIQITNRSTEEREFTAVTVNKEWKKADDTELEEPPVKYIEVTLYRNGEPYKTAYVKASEDWSYTFKNLPVKDSNNVDYVWTVKETTEIGGFKSEVTSTEPPEEGGLGFKLTNTFKNDATVNATVNKVWQRTNTTTDTTTTYNPSGYTATFQLYQSLTPPKEPTPAGPNSGVTGWVELEKVTDSPFYDASGYDFTKVKVKFSGVVKGCSGCYFTFAENAGWANQKQSDEFSSDLLGKSEYEYNVPKEWQMKKFVNFQRGWLGNDADAVTVTSVEVFVPEKDPYAYADLPDDANPYLNEVTISKGDGWTHIWKNLPKQTDSGDLYYYYIVETATSVSGQKASYENEGVADQDGNFGVTVTNSSTTTEDYYDLPKTGGRGTLPYTLGGTLLILVSLMCGYISRRKKQGRRFH